MQEKLTHFYLDQEEPLKSTLLALHDYIVAFDPEIQAVWKWSSPFFTYQNKNICYLWSDKRTRHPYIGFIEGHKIEHPLLFSGDRKQIKILSIDPNADLPVKAMKEILAMALALSNT